MVCSGGKMAEKGKEIVIIGGGVGGYVAAIRAAQLGAHVSLIEKDLLGGTCINRGCIPTKALLQSAKVMSCVNNAGKFGVNIGNVSLDFSKVAERKDTVVNQLRNGVASLMSKNSIKVIAGTAELLDPTRVRIAETGQAIQSEALIIATGSRSCALNIPGIDQTGALSSDEFLAMKDIPASALVIGGGVIGLEYAQILHGLGCKVTIVEMTSQLLPREDEEMAAAIKDILSNIGIKVFTDSCVARIEDKGKAKKKAVITTKNGQSTETVDNIVVIVGREPNTGGLLLREIGIEVDHGAIKVNARMETNVSGVYAVGDVTGGYMLAHVAMHEGVCAAENAMGKKTCINYNNVPRCIYTSPEMAAVGLSEREAREKYRGIQIGRFPFTANGMAVAQGATDGMVKVITDTEYGAILGVHILGPHATELIMEAVLAIQLEATVEDIAAAIHPHPTLCEAIMEASLRTRNLSIHI